tara:strand:+ start:9 stop:368 length:360 start_codon:yes stop_codon:yes gene_type:complete
MPERNTQVDAKTIMTRDQTIGPPYKSLNPECGRLSENDPKDVRRGAKTPFKVACAITENTTRAKSPRKFPVAAKIVSLDVQPRAIDIPNPKNIPPKIIEKIGSLFDNSLWSTISIIPKY